uniref:Uncharacterized protein n=1 Tax=Fundulus heteroclitus TaxID=8078 RepID=A0A3Q2QRR8_FUNHE
MSKLGLRDNDKCWRCEKERATLVHTFYECEIVHNLWAADIQCINKVLKVEFREGLGLCILGILPMKSGMCTLLFVFKFLLFNLLGFVLFFSLNVNLNLFVMLMFIHWFCI